MISVSVTEKGGETNLFEFDKNEISIGRIQGNDIVLAKSNISKRHARIVDNDGAFVVIDAKSTNGTYINGKRIDAPYDMRAGDKIFVGDFTIEILTESASKKAAPPPPPSKAKPEGSASTAVAAKKDELLADDEWAAASDLKDDWKDDWADDDAKKDAEVEAVDADDADEDEGAFEPSSASLKSRPTADIDDGPLPTGVRPLPKADSVKKTVPVAPVPAAKKAKAEPSVEAPTPTKDTKAKPSEPKVSAFGGASTRKSDAHVQAQQLVHERLLRSMDLRRLGVERMGDAELQERTRSAIAEIIAALSKSRELPAGVDAKALAEDVLHEAVGLGPLEDLLKDESVTEILVNGASQVFVERNGKLEPASQAFSSDQAVLSVIERIVAPIGRRIDESSPMVDARLKDGSRVNAVVPPLSLRGPCITIRKFTKEPLQIDDLVAFGTITADVADFLETCVKARKNIVISGGTGSGKTTTLNVLSGFIPAHERIITIEDAAELKLDQAHVVSLEARPPNIEGKGAVTIRDLVKNALRMRPDRIVVGECRGGEALDMLQAMNTGHDGSLTTVHANGPRDALSRLETMVLMSGMDLPIRAVRDQIANAVDIVVQQTRFPDGSRRITHVSEITGMEGDVIAMQDLFVFEQRGFDAQGKVKGAMKPTGMIPKFYETLSAMGMKADLSIFRKG